MASVGVVAPFSVTVMCGRFVGAYTTGDVLAELSEAMTQSHISLELPHSDTSFANNFNTAPTHHVPVLRYVDGHVVMEKMQWGLVPAWSKDPAVGSKMINARSETITEKPSFRGLVQKYRCIVPMSGFYEWDRTDPKHKVPYFVTRADGHLMLAAGLWTSSPALGGQLTFTMITRESVEDLSEIHNRCLVELDAFDAIEWMIEPTAPLELFDATRQPRLATQRVSTRVNSVMNNDSTLIELDDSVPLVADTGQDTLF